MEPPGVGREGLFTFPRLLLQGRRCATLSILGEEPSTGMLFAVTPATLPTSTPLSFSLYDSGPLPAMGLLLEPRVSAATEILCTGLLREPFSPGWAESPLIFTADIVWAPPMALVLWAGEPGLGLKPLLLGGNLLSQDIPSDFLMLPVGAAQFLLGLCISYWS